ncbi:hypothetical protein [uncultured Eubacterium sp.]|uniref:hypothetical protein n=1 Tax=uncultured Eubacterium sp. TaxID=165185 RepID=UPI002594E78F|nr:hypothetical protein [uncultured Eubacterium sp.]
MDNNSNLIGITGLLQMILGFGTFAIVCSDMFGYKIPKKAVPVIGVVYIVLLALYIYLYIKLRKAGTFDVEEKKEKNIKEILKGKK